MSQTHTKIEGTLDKKPLTAHEQTAVQKALVSTLQGEALIRGPRHIKITHIDIVFEAAHQ